MSRVHATELGAANDTEAFLRLVLGKRQEPDDTWVFRGQRLAKWDLRVREKITDTSYAS